MAITLNASTSSGLVQTADTSGVIELQSAGATKMSVGSTGTSIAQYNPAASLITSGTAVSASGTSVDFTSIPSWVKRITVMLNGVSLAGNGAILIQLGDSGGIENTGYGGQIVYINGSAPGSFTFSSGVNLYGTSVGPSILNSGSIVFTHLSGNIWVFQGAVNSTNSSATNYVAGAKTLSATLDRVRVTTETGTDTFDAGTINILYE
jgi:hypothetical protein